ncbi:hypothetical protein CDV36_006634 [Fusarium kuroshium]|uniref:Uncharacterized protein n=1 Tax=Fusarium kuroshium TaxID=2010991 RepID=A0A3M2S804_9HYPO|nr:hypothetical protein CDV36_006634 [Fusarium kuroshium]
MIPREDGYVHGCVFCNTIDHDTIRCAKYTRDFDSQVRVLVTERGNMPPLKDGEWHEITQECIHRSLISFEDGFPWTPEFGKMVLKTPELLEKAREGIEYLAKRPVDPKTRSWATIEDTIEGGSGKFESKLMDIGWI